MPTDTPPAPLSGDSSASLTATTLSTDLSQTQLIANGVSFDYSGVPVLRNVDLTLSAGDVLGLVGDNGAGKSALMWVLSGRRKPTSGVVTHVGQRVLGSQELEAPFDSTGTMLVHEALGPSLRRLQAFEEATEALANADTGEEVARANERYSTIFSDVTAHDDWNAEHNADIILDSLGLTNDDSTTVDGQPLLTRRTANLSGGQRARLGLALTLIRNPEILLLDEPTNHLDDRGRELVIDHIRNHAGVVVVATHDRDFLDAVCTHIGDIVPRREGIHIFRGNYTAYDKHRRHERALWEHQWRTEQREKNQLEQDIELHHESAGPKKAKRDNEKLMYGMAGNRAERQLSRRIRAARQRLTELEENGVEQPPAVLGLDAPLTAPIPRRRVAAGSDEDFAVKLQGLVVPDRVRVGSLTIRPGEKVVITGPNGAGKSSLLGAIAGAVPTESGQVRIGEDQHIGVLRQEQRWEDPTQSAENLYALAPHPTVSFDELGLLAPEDAIRPVGDLSIGQQRRVALALIAARPPHILLLDEPTNHLSVDLIEEVQDAIATAEGTVLVVTHDRRMISRLEARHLIVDHHEVVEGQRGHRTVEFQ